MRILTVGASDQSVCGVRDHALTLAAALEARGASMSTAWWERRTDEPWRRTAAAARAWAAGAADAAREADVVLWHYSTFSYGRRGLPVLAPRAAAALARSGRPVVPFFHELALQWRDRSWRGTTQAAAQRLALASVLRRSAGAIVTSSDRADWLDTRRWLPRRPAAVVPVFSNIPVAASANGAGHGLRVGVFGFRMVYDQVDAVTVAFASLRERRPEARLVLVGAPGPESDHADRWRAAMARTGCAEGLEFSGVLAPDALSAALAGLDTVVYADPSGPTSRRGTLAAALAHGRPIVALDGPQRWDSLTDAGALVLSPPDPVALAEQLERFAADPELRRRVGERGRAFYERSMAPPVAAERVLAFLEEIA